uniref:Uncharacterized protein n=1 Tax=Cannabis sativa TaxID=3483 RepID=A0A803R398_CANSA
MLYLMVSLDDHSSNQTPFLIYVWPKSTFDEKFDSTIQFLHHIPPPAFTKKEKYIIQSFCITNITI